MNKTEEAQKKSIELGHCTCSTKFTCPCRWFIDKNECYCGGDKIKNRQNWFRYNTKTYGFSRFVGENQKTTKDYVADGKRNAKLLEKRAMEDKK